MRTDNASPAVNQSRASQERFAALVEERRRALVPFETRIPPRMGFDMAYVRWRREVHYVHRLFDTLNWLRDADCGEVDYRLLLCSTFVHPQVWATSYLNREAARQGIFDIQFTMPLWMRTFERKERHRSGHYVPGHCREAPLINANGMSRCFIPLVFWWDEVEISYSMRAEAPAILAYAARMLMADPYHKAWRIVRTEWTFQVAKDLIYQARDGRLFWISVPLRQDMGAIGLDRLLADSDDDVKRQLHELLNFIEELRWSECPEENRISAPEVSGPSPVFVTGDYFPFDPERWIPDVEDHFFIPRNQDGSLAEPRSNPGRKAGNGAWRLRSENHPDGRPRGDRQYYTSGQRRSGMAGRAQVREGRVNGPARGRFRGNRGFRGRGGRGGTGLRSVPMDVVLRTTREVAVAEAQGASGSASATGDDPIIPDSGVGVCADFEAEDGEIQENRTTNSPVVQERQVAGLRERYGLLGTASGVGAASTSAESTYADTALAFRLQSMGVTDVDETTEDLPDEWYKDLEAAEAVASHVDNETLPQIVDLTANNTVLPGPPRPVTLVVKKEVALQRE